MDVASIPLPLDDNVPSDARKGAAPVSNGFPETERLFSEDELSEESIRLALSEDEEEKENEPFVDTTSIDCTNKLHNACDKNDCTVTEISNDTESVKLDKIVDKIDADTKNTIESSDKQPSELISIENNIEPTKEDRSKTTEIVDGEESAPDADSDRKQSGDVTNDVLESITKYLDNFEKNSKDKSVNKELETENVADSKLEAANAINKSETLDVVDSDATVPLETNSCKGSTDTEPKPESKCTEPQATEQKEIAAEHTNKTEKTENMDSGGKTVKPDKVGAEDEKKIKLETKAESTCETSEGSTEIINDLLVEDDRKMESDEERIPSPNTNNLSSDEVEDQNSCHSPSLDNGTNEIDHFDGHLIIEENDESEQLVLDESAHVGDNNSLSIHENTLPLMDTQNTDDEINYGSKLLNETDMEVDNGKEASVECITEDAPVDLRNEGVVVEPKVKSALKRISEIGTNSGSEPAAKKLKSIEITHMTEKQISKLVEYITLIESKTFTIEQLEQHLIQKICEAIVDKSELGDLRHNIQLLEQKVETWRHKSVQLAKQMRDLEVVMRKCSADVKSGKEMIVPLRNTRSVGLQVNTSAPVPVRPRVEVTNQPKRRQRTVLVAQNTNHQIVANSAVKNVAANINNIKTSPSKQIKIMPAKGATVQQNSLLSKALQTKEKAHNNVGVHLQKVTIAPAVAQVTKTVVPVNVQHSKGVIDLTDEEDNKGTQNSIPIAAGAATAIVTSNPTGGQRIMYVVPNRPIQPGIIATANDPSRAGPQTKTYIMKFPASAMTQTNGAQTLNIFKTSSLQNGAVSIVPQLNNSNSIRPMPPLRMAQTSRIPLGIKDSNSHPAPLPLPPASQPTHPHWKPMPPRPILSIRKDSNGIILSWKMPPNLSSFEDIASYQLYAYQETLVKPTSDMWRKVGDVKALPLPMACTLSQFADGNKYYFAVRAVDVKQRLGHFSAPEEILS